MLFLPPTPRLTPPDVSTQLWYKLNEAASPAANSGQAGALNATATGQVQFSCQGLFGPCTYFSKNNSNGAYITTADTSVAETSGVWSISAWVNIREYTAAFPGFLCKKYRTAGSWTAPFFSVILGPVNTSDGSWQVNMTKAGPTNVGVTVGGANQRQFNIPLNVWTLVSGTSDKNTLTAYFNGQAAGTTAIGSNVSVDWGTHGGWTMGGIADSTADQMRGFIGEVRFENVVRSQAYYQAMYMNGLGWFNP